jgi:hypothetical protein
MTSDGYIRAHAVLARRLGADRVRGISGEDYRDASWELRDAGDEAAAGAVTGIAAAVRELGSFRSDWERRYEARPRTRAQREADGMLASCRVRRADAAGLGGIDGALYTRAGFRLYSSTVVEPVVVVTTLAGTTEVVTGFRGQRERDAWLADRSPGRDGALVSALDGPSCRAAREELVLARLLRHQRPGVVLDWPRPETFTTYSRSEIFQAWHDAPPGATAPQVAGQLDRRLLRAPSWGDCDVGAPGARTAPAYLHRLAATPVTEARAAAALHDLAVEDATPAGTVTHTGAVPGPAPRATHLRLVQPPPAPGTHPDPGPAPRF